MIRASNNSRNRPHGSDEMYGVVVASTWRAWAGDSPVAGARGDVARLPYPHAAGRELGPQLGQPVPHVQGVGHQRGRGDVRAAEQHAELGGRELTGERRAGPAVPLGSFGAGQRGSG